MNLPARSGLRPGPFAPPRVGINAAGYGRYAGRYADGGDVEDPSGDPAKQAYYDSLHSSAINSIIQGGLRGFADGGGIDPMSGLGGGGPSGAPSPGPGPGIGAGPGNSSQNGGMNGAASPSSGGPTAGGVGGFIGGLVGGLVGSGLGPAGSLGAGALGRAGGRSLGEALAKAFSPDPEDQTMAPSVDENVSEVGTVGPGSGQVGIGNSEGVGGMDGSVAGPSTASEGQAGVAAASPGDAGAGTGESSGGTGGTGSEGAGGYAYGGSAGGGGFDGIHQPQTRGVGGNLSHGLVASQTPGRADNVMTKVPAGTYIVPADVTSIMGQGNTLAGKAKLDGHFGTAPSHNGFAAGGMVDVRLSGGEYRVSPDKVAGIGGGSLERGRQILDGHVARIRREEVVRLKSAPGPKQ